MTRNTSHTVTTPSTPSTPSTPHSIASPVPSEPRPRFRDLLAAEWLTMRSLRSTVWSYVIGALVVIAFNGGAAYDRYRYWHEYDARSRADFVSEAMAFMYVYTTNAGIVMMLVAGAVGALAITGEYSTGQIRAVFAAVPARRSLMAAKVCVLTAAMAVFGAVAAGVSFWLTQAILGARGAGVSIGDPGALRIVVASTLLAPVSALAGVALGAVLRHSAGAVVSVVALLLVLPLVLSDDRYWSAVVGHAMPVSAWTRLVDLRYDPSAVPFPWTTTGAWAVYGLWATVAAVVAVCAVHRRDQ